jgi:hypothetical protein
MICQKISSRETMVAVIVIKTLKEIIEVVDMK